jgi:hypothetical protein
MRLIVVGCEYSGVTTLIDGLTRWGAARGIQYHLDDHFSIPDGMHLSAEDAQQMLALSPVLKERFQRMQVVYHVRVMHHYDQILLGGYHIEEEVYGPLYYYPSIGTVDCREYEADMPPDTILVLLKARPEVIHARMAVDPHPFPVVKAEDVALVLGRFQQEFDRSSIRHKLVLDTSDLTPAELLDTFLERSVLHLNTQDMLLRLWDRRS